jgi:excisionase family DNA binding protein
MTDEEMLTVTDVANRLKVPASTVRRWLREGRLRGVLLGGTKLGYRVRVSDLERFVQQAYGAETPDTKRVA